MALQSPIVAGRICVHCLDENTFYRQGSAQFQIPKLRVYMKQPLYRTKGRGKVCVHLTLHRPHVRKKS